MENKTELREEKIKVGIPFPPDDIFKYRKDRFRPANEVWGPGTISYIPDRAEYIKGKGNFVYYKGFGNQPAPKYPSKTIAPIEAIYAINGIKRLLMNTMRLLSSKEIRILMFPFFLLTRKKKTRILNKVVEYFVNSADMIPGLTGWYLEDDYYCSVSKEIQSCIQAFLIKSGVDVIMAKRGAEIIGMMFEYDNAYRYRIQDLMNEADKDWLIHDFPSEVERLIKIQKERETRDDSVVQRFSNIANVLFFLWNVSFVREAIQEGIRAIDFEAVKLDESDIYHTLLYGDYNTQGKTQEERFAIYESIHGTDKEKWPARIMIK